MSQPPHVGTPTEHDAPTAEFAAPNLSGPQAPPKRGRGEDNSPGTTAAVPVNPAGGARADQPSNGPASRAGRRGAQQRTPIPRTAGRNAPPVEADPAAGRPATAPAGGNGAGPTERAPLVTGSAAGVPGWAAPPGAAPNVPPLPGGPARPSGQGGPLGPGGPGGLPNQEPQHGPLRGGAPARGPRRAKLQLRHIDPMTVLRFSCVLAVALFFVWMIVVGMLFLVLDASGAIGKVNDTVTTINGPGSHAPVTTGIVFGGAAIVGVINVVLFIALSTVGSLVYNLCADLVGGIELTLSER